MATSAGTADSPSVIFAYAIYTRQSRVSNDITLSSCDVQCQICRDHAEAIFPRAIPRCGTRYDDPGQSGEDPERPALQALLAEIEKGTISHVVVYRLDRLSRRLADTVQILDTFKRHAVDLRIVTAPSLAASATSHFMLNVLASFAEFEHGLISERIKESVRDRPSPEAKSTALRAIEPSQMAVERSSWRTDPGTPGSHLNCQQAPSGSHLNCQHAIRKGEPPQVPPGVRHSPGLLGRPAAARRAMC